MSLLCITNQDYKYHSPVFFRNVANDQEVFKNDGNNAEYSMRRPSAFRNNDSTDEFHFAKTSPMKCFCSSRCFGDFSFVAVEASFDSGDEPFLATAFARRVLR